MRRIIRRLAKIGYWLTLFACAALTGGSGVIWVRSQFVSDEVFCSLDSYKPGPTVDTLRWKHRAIDIWTNCARTGCIRIRLLNDHLMAKANSGRIRHDGIEVDHFSLPASPILDDDKLKFDLVGFGEYLERSDSKYGTVRGLHLSLPDWSITATTGVLTTILLYRWWRRRSRLRKGLCPQCAYDLRASTERCPECGFQISQTVTAGKSSAAELPS